MFNFTLIKTKKHEIAMIEKSQFGMNIYSWLFHTTFKK